MNNYWLCLFTGTSWSQFLNADDKQVGFNKTQIKQAQKINKGDYLISYLTKVSRFIAILEVTEEAVISSEQKWTEGLFPVRIGAKIVKQLPIPSAISMSAFLGKLSFLMAEEMPVSGVWSAHVRSSPRRWKNEDGEAVSKLIDKLIESGENPNLKVGISKHKATRKRGNLDKLNRVGSLIRRTKKLGLDKFEISAGTKVLSRNQVTGYAVNFPIQKTCRPTPVCKDTCYFAVKLNASIPALTLQHRNLYFCQQDPEEFARHVIYGYDNAGLSYLRWNGGGDLFNEALEAIEYIRIHRPDIVLWIVSRKAELAAQLKYHNNHHIHLSLDRSLIDQKAQIRSMFKHDKVFFSYQVHPEETVENSVIDKVDLIFMHDYQAIPSEFEESNEKFCPLNGANTITDACGQCRRCFDGSLAS
ncbi:EVE domain-containing protein [Paracoccaceae bacterium]|nr:EVE domain-containing protein [Paracoccaceae bacterium]